MTEYRELKYLVKKSDGTITSGEILRDVLKLSSREISRCKQFEDGVLVERSNEADKIAVPIRLIDQLSPGDTLIVRIYEDNDNAGDIVPS